MHVYLIAGAAAWGIVSGLLLPRAAYRLAVAPDQPWAAACPAGHPLAGWLGPARCEPCARAASAAPDGDAPRTPAPAPRADPAPTHDLAPAGDAAPQGRPAPDGDAAPAYDPAPAGDPAPEARPAPGQAPPPPGDPAPGGGTVRRSRAGAAVRPRYGLGYGAAAGCAVVCAAMAYVVGARPELAVWLLLIPVGIVLARVDLLVFRLPDAVTLPALGGTTALLGLAALLPAHDGSWPRALLAAAALGALYFVLFFINPSGMGFGDVKLAPTLGLALGWYGWPTVFLGAFAGFALGALTALGLVAARRANRKTPIPFGPFMLVGALGALLVSA